MNKYILKMFNIPRYKTSEDLESEFRNIGIFDTFLLMMKGNQENAGYALIEFSSQELLDVFAIKYHKLRRDAVIYKEI